MLKLIIGCRRNPKLSRAEFAAYHTGPHAQLVLSVPEFRRHLRKYEQNHVIAPTGALSLYGDGADFTGRDVVASLWFDSIAALERAFQEPRYLEIIRPDEAKFADLADPDLSFLLTQEAEIFVSGRPREFKLVEFLAPQAQISASDFLGRLLLHLAELRSSGICDDHCSSLVCNFAIPIGEGGIWPPPTFSAVVEIEFADLSRAREFHRRRKSLASSHAMRNCVHHGRSVELVTRCYEILPAPNLA